MGAHNPATLAAARQRIEYMRNQMNPLASWHGTLTAVLDRGPVSGSIRKWIREGVTVDTLQVDVKLDSGEPAGFYAPWAPQNRTCDRVGSAFMHLNGSRRDFAGMVTYAATEDYWIGFADSFQPDSITLICYRVIR